MGLNDGWVGERVSADHTVVPDLGGASSPADSINLDNGPTATIFSPSPNFSPSPSFDATSEVFQTSTVSEAQAQDSSGLGKVLVAPVSYTHLTLPTTPYV